MNGSDAAREQLGNDMAVLLGCAIYCLLLAPAVARAVHPFAFGIACWVRARTGGERTRTGTDARGALGRLDTAMAGFRLPFACRQAVRDRLLEGWVMIAVAVVFIVTPMLVPFGMQTLAQAERAETDRGLAAAFTVTTMFLGAFGGTMRYCGPRLEVPAVRSVCNALSTAHRVWQGKAS
jgi:cytochrome bd-type quinol oxidase subunit 2